MQQIDDLTYYDNNSKADDDDEDVDDTFQDAIQVEDVVKDTDDDDTTTHGEPINAEFTAQKTELLE